MPTFEKNVINNENAIEGHAVDGRGVVGSSVTDYGMRAYSKKSAGLRASSDEGNGLEGWGGQTGGAGIGVVGTSKSGYGIYGKCESNHGVLGESDQGSGVVGIAKLWHGVYGETNSSTGGAGLCGEHKGNGIGTLGKSDNGVGVLGTSINNEGVRASSHSTATAAMAVYHENVDSPMPALHVEHLGNERWAAHFVGNVVITKGDLVVSGVIHMTRGDYAEDFTVANPEDVEPGMVMVLDEIGGVRVSDEAYDRRVAGVVSGAGNYKPAVILDHDDALPNRLPLALMGKVYCMVDATDSPVEIGDLLTTSSVPGHAMKAHDPLRAFGSIIGKALQPLMGGRGLVPILVRFQ